MFLLTRCYCRSCTLINTQNCVLYLALYRFKYQTLCWPLHCEALYALCSPKHIHNTHKYELHANTFLNILKNSTWYLNSPRSEKPPAVRSAAAVHRIITILEQTSAHSLLWVPRPKDTQQLWLRGEAVATQRQALSPLTHHSPLSCTHTEQCSLLCS